MKLHFLGTGAADWQLAEKDSSEYRFFSSALIDGVLLIDPGPHVFLSAEKFSIDLSNIKYIINTHKHSDHYSEDTVNALALNGAEFIDFVAGETKKIGEYTISAFEANHSTAEKAVHFIIEREEKSIFYGLDGAWLLYDEVKAIKEKGIDLAVLDATIGNIYGDYRIFEHNNLTMVKEIKASLNNHIKRFVISHLAYTLHEKHDYLSKEMQLFDIETAFDNFITEI